MRSLLAALLTLPGAAAPASPGSEAFLASESIAVREVPGPIPADPGAALWDGVPAVPVAAAPQRTLSLHDRRANQALASAQVRSVGVRAASDGASLAVLLEWSDPTEDRTADETDSFADGAALEIPLHFGPGRRLPYVGMGDEDEPVAIHLQRAGPGSSTSAREGIGRGFGSFRRADVGGAQVRVAMRYDRAAKAWRALFLRPLVAGGLDLRRGLVPVAVAIWDGAGGERGGNKALSRWKFLRLSSFPLDPAWLAELSWGYGPGELGNAARGKELVEGMCTPCHRIGEASAAPPGIAPDLGAIGAIATPSYLRDSIVSPSAVLVPSPNPAQHQDRSAKPDARGAFPPDSSYVWYRVDERGKKVSTMPDYGSMPQDDLADSVAYLRTLGGEPPGGRRQP